MRSVNKPGLYICLYLTYAGRLWLLLEQAVVQVKFAVRSTSSVCRQSQRHADRQPSIIFHVFELVSTVVRVISVNILFIVFDNQVYFKKSVGYNRDFRIRCIVLNIIVCHSTCEFVWKMAHTLDCTDNYFILTLRHDFRFPSHLSLYRSPRSYIVRYWWGGVEIVQACQSSEETQVQPALNSNESCTLVSLCSTAHFVATLGADKLFQQ